jgi:hypothetical protein
MDLHSCETRVPGNASYMRKAFNNVNDFIVAQRARLAEAATRNGNRNAGMATGMSDGPTGSLATTLGVCRPAWLICIQR